MVVLIVMNCMKNLILAGMIAVTGKGSIFGKGWAYPL